MLETQVHGLVLKEGAWWGLTSLGPFRVSDKSVRNLSYLGFLPQNPVEGLFESIQRLSHGAVAVVPGIIGVDRTLSLGSEPEH